MSARRTLISLSPATQQVKESVKSAMEDTFWTQIIRVGLTLAATAIPHVLTVQSATIFRVANAFNALR